MSYKYSLRRKWIRDRTRYSKRHNRGLFTFRWKRRPGYAKGFITNRPNKANKYRLLMFEDNEYLTFNRKTGKIYKRRKPFEILPF